MQSRNKMLKKHTPVSTGLVLHFEYGFTWLLPPISLCLPCIRVNSSKGKPNNNYRQHYSLAQTSGDSQFSWNDNMKRLCFCTVWHLIITILLYIVRRCKGKLLTLADPLLTPDQCITCPFVFSSCFKRIILFAIATCCSTSRKYMSTLLTGTVL